MHWTWKGAQSKGNNYFHNYCSWPFFHVARVYYIATIRANKSSVGSVKAISEHKASSPFFYLAKLLNISETFHP